jgi:type II secretory pathway pseudopilin PulG
MQRQSANTLVEVLVGVAIMGILFTSLFASLTWGFTVTRVSRENLRATQIMVEHVEGVRLYNWDQIMSSNWLPALFTNYYYPVTNNGESPGVAYIGSMTISNAPFTTSYGSNLALITVSVNWTSANVPRSRTMSTLVSKHGMQNYIFNQ